MLLTMEQCVKAFEPEEIVNQAVNDVYKEYSRLARITGNKVWPKLHFSREVRRTFGVYTKRRRVNGKLVSFYVRKDD